MAQIDVLQLGEDNWSEQYEIPDSIKWHFFTTDEFNEFEKYINKEKIKSFQVILFSGEEAIDFLMCSSLTFKPYTIYHDQRESFDFTYHIARSIFYKSYTVRAIDMSNKQQIIEDCSRYFFSGQYGDKLFPSSIAVSPSFKGEIEYDGNISVNLKGDFGTQFTPLAYWVDSIYILQNIELWLEFEKSDSCDIQLTIQLTSSGSSDAYKKMIIRSDELQEAIPIAFNSNATIAVSLEAKGTGTIKIGSLHQRLSRGPYGKFLLGGEILKDEKRQEINAYFEPGDLQPPLTVYFSGFRPAEGFEAYYLIKSLGGPFLLFSDPRLLGGAFYMGSDELEGKIISKIQSTLDYLNFTNQEMVFAGLSMGTYGSLYYASDFSPRAIVLGKVLASLGDIAKNGKLVSPGSFPTSFDILKYHTGGSQKGHIEQLNHRFWDKFNRGDFSKTIFAISYMKQDDYDQFAYENLLKNLYNRTEKIISKSTEGRHVDGSDEAFGWFINQLKAIETKEFNREIK